MLGWVAHLDQARLARAAGLVTGYAEAVAALADTAGVRVVADEIHSPLVLAGAAFTPYLSVPGAGAGFSLLSASKAWNLAGMKAAVVFAGLDRNRRLLGELLVTGLPDVGWSPPEGTYLAWLDCAGIAAIPDDRRTPAAPVRGDASAQVGVAAWWLERARVLLSESTVKDHLQALARKLGVGRRAQLVFEATRRGLL